MYDDSNHIDEVVSVIKYNFSQQNNVAVNKMKYAYLYIAKHNLVADVLERFGLQNVEIEIEDAYTLLWWLPSMLSLYEGDSKNLLSPLSNYKKDDLIDIMKDTYEDVDDKVYDIIQNIEERIDNYAEIAYLYLFKRLKILYKRGAPPLQYNGNFSHPYNAITYVIDNLDNAYLNTDNSKIPYVVSDKYAHRRKYRSINDSNIIYVNYDNLADVIDKFGILINPANNYFNEYKFSNVEELQQRLQDFPPPLTDREKAYIYGHDPSTKFLGEEIKLNINISRTTEDDSPYYLYAEVSNYRLNGKYRKYKGDTLLNDNEIRKTVGYTIAEYKDGILDGPYEHRNEFGSYIIKGLMRDGRKHGIWDVIDHDSSITSYHIHGKEVSRKEYEELQRKIEFVSRLINKDVGENIIGQMIR